MDAKNETKNTKTHERLIQRILISSESSFSFHKVTISYNIKSLLKDWKLGR